MEDEKKDVAVTSQEAFWLWVMRRNQAEKKDRIDRKLDLGRLEIRYRRRRKSEFWGRFGGGWNWNVGVQVGSGTVIVNLLVASVSLTMKKDEQHEE